jgi:hypothetical protein
VSALFKVLEFYTKDAWTKNEDGTMVPSAALLADRGVIALDFMHPTVQINPPPEAAVQAAYMMAAAEVAEALRDLLHAMAMPHTEARTMKIGSLCVALQNAEYRLRSVTRS